MSTIDQNAVSAFVSSLLAVELDASQEPIFRQGYIKVLLGKTWRAARSGGTRARCDWSTESDEAELTDEIVRLVQGEIDSEKHPGKCWVHAYLRGEQAPYKTLSPIAYEPGDIELDIPETQGEALLRVTMELLRTNVILTRDVRSMSKDQMDLAYRLGETSAQARSGADAAQWEAVAATAPHFLSLAERLINQPGAGEPASEDGDACPEDGSGAWDWHTARLNRHAASMFGLVAHGKLTADAGKARIDAFRAQLVEAIKGIDNLKKAPGWG